ncbi:cytochrome c oxidase subunit 2 [Pseudorhizobium tarimense]|uniref:Cytochrome c oxidase subunit 2 n=1 Tax=Pseudorhizobium tarimense TaxID=1079109 RepID=A0ABV2H908_9HYPH|nr:c-type cytochrome [Pseudorhizobium tarimense]MCJ8520137.1 c-type cytochrome [Pseudorhizobium tarimense]
MSRIGGAYLSRSAQRGAVLRAALLFGCIPLSSCSGVQSALDPAGPEAANVATLFYVMLVGGSLIWIGVVGVLAYASRLGREPHSERMAGWVILLCGAVGPAVILGALLSYAVWLMPNLRPWTSSGEPGLRQIEVTGEQFWWRARYLDPSGAPLFEAANEIVMPVGERVLFTLKSPDVIHSFWIPSLGGKMDAIPGRINAVTLEASKAGLYRGACAEFCGPSHALMAFTVKAVEPAAFEEWLDERAAVDRPSDAEGLAVFLRHGCGACHTIAGTQANGEIGPNLTAVGARETIAAGTLPNTTEAIARFIRNPEEIKPGVHMPAFDMLPDGDVEMIAAYLKGLK